MKLQSESVPEKRQSWSVWRADGKETVLLEDIATSSKDTPENINNELHVGDFLTEINSDKEERNSPEPSECFPTNGIFDLTDHHLSPERTEEVNMAAQTKGEEFKHLIVNGGLSPKETHTRNSTLASVVAARNVRIDRSSMIHDIRPSVCPSECP